MDVNFKIGDVFQYLLIAVAIVFIFLMLRKLAVARRVWVYLLFLRWWSRFQDYLFVEHSNSRTGGWRVFFFKYVLISAGIFWMFPWYLSLYRDGHLPEGLQVGTLLGTEQGADWISVLLAAPIPVLLYPNAGVQLLIVLAWYVGVNAILSMWACLLFSAYDYRANLAVAIKSNPKWKEMAFKVQKLNPFLYKVVFSASSWIDAESLHAARKKLGQAGKISLGGMTEDVDGNFLFEVGTKFPARLGNEGRNEDPMVLYSGVGIAEAKVINRVIERQYLGARYNAQHAFMYWIGRGFTDHYWDTRSTPHLGIGGKSGGGKSRFMMGAMSVMARQDPDTLFIIVDAAKRGRVFGNVIYRPSELFSEARGNTHINTWKKRLRPMRNVIVVESLEQYVAIVDALEVEEKWRAEFFKAHPTPDGTDFSSFVDVSPVNPEPMKTERGLGRIVFVFDEVAATQLDGRRSKGFGDAFEKMQGMIFKNRDVGFSFVMVSQRFTVDIIGETRDQFRMIAFSPEQNEVEFMFKIKDYQPVHGVGIYNTRMQSMMSSMTVGAAPRTRLVDMMTEFERAEKRMTARVWSNHRRVFDQYYGRLNPEIAELATERQREFHNTAQMTPEEYSLWSKKRKAAKA